MLLDGFYYYRRNSPNPYVLPFCCMLLVAIVYNIEFSEQQDSLFPKLEPLVLDLQHKFGINQQFKPRGSIYIKPRTENRVAQASIINQPELSDSDLKAFEEATKRGDWYYLRAILRRKKGDKIEVVKTTQTLVKTCSLYVSNLADFIIVNMSPSNEFLNVNLFTTDPECTGQEPEKLKKEFNTTVSVESGSVGPTPDTATYVKRLEEEQQNKRREGKEENQSFFAKYWIYIVPAVIILMIFSGPADQGGR